MAILLKSLDAIGDDISCFPDEYANDLSKIMVAMIYHRIDIASSILIRYDDETLILLQGIAKELQDLCEVCLFEKRKEWR